MEEEKKESGGEQKVTDDGRHPQLDGIQKVTDEKVNALIDKVIEKIVRVEVTDGRIFLGMLKSVDKTKTIFIQDALELIDKEGEHYIHHEVMTPGMLEFIPKD